MLRKSSNNSRRVCACVRGRATAEAVSCPRGRPSASFWLHSFRSTSPHQYLFIWTRLFMFFMSIEKHYERLTLKLLTGLAPLKNTTTWVFLEKTPYFTHHGCDHLLLLNRAEKYWVYKRCPLWHHRAHCEMKKCLLFKVAPNGLWRFGLPAAEMVLLGD